MMLIDTHIHLDDARYEEDFNAVLERAREGGVARFIIPGADPLNLARARMLSHHHEELFFAVGVHPYDIDAYDEAYLMRFALDDKCVAVGECGLDYFRLPEDAEEKLANIAHQKEIFRAQIRLAKRLKKPLIVHIRDASHDAKTILIEENAREVGGVLHCFNADHELLALAGHNFYFGIGGVVTFNNARKLIEVLPRIPHEKLLIETDGPYLTPHPHRGTRNEPLYTTFVAQKMADVLKLSADEIHRITTQNALRLFPQLS